MVVRKVQINSAVMKQNHSISVIPIGLLKSINIHQLKVNTTYQYVNMRLMIILLLKCVFTKIIILSVLCVRFTQKLLKGY